MSLWKVAAIGAGIYILWKVNETSNTVSKIGDAAGPIGKVADGINSIVQQGKDIIGGFASGFGGLADVAGGNSADGVSQMSAGENGGWYDGMDWGYYDKETGLWHDNAPGYY